MKLYSGPFSMFGAKAQIAVAEKNIACDVELVPFSFRKGYAPKHPEVLRVNPKAQVPVLVDCEVSIYDSTQIFEYLEHWQPQPALWPQAPAARARARRLEHEVDGVFFPLVVVLIEQYATRDSEPAKAARQDASAYYSLIERVLAGRDYLAEEYSYADIALIMAHYFAVFLGADISADHQQFDNWRRRILKRSAVRSVIEPINVYLRAKNLEPPAFTRVPEIGAEGER